MPHSTDFSIDQVNAPEAKIWASPILVTGAARLPPMGWWV
jgi:hypothetical protein